MNIDSDVERLREEIIGWHTRFDGAEIAYRETRLKGGASTSDFDVFLRAEFFSSQLDFMNCALEIGVDIRLGFAVGVQIESRERLAKRLRTRALEPTAYAGGFEADNIPQKSLFALLDFISDGHISITATHWPLLGLGWTAASASDATRQQLSTSESYDSSWWLFLRDQRYWFTTTLKYKAWPRTSQ